MHLTVTSTFYDDHNVTTPSILTDEYSLYKEILQFATHTGVIILLSVLIAVACIFVLCGLLMKAEAHVNTSVNRNDAWLQRSIMDEGDF
ncbi:unnamed protein product [Dimorphilus gyrociliatus]|uniref:Uncharacterized protein n=1 Tax=Dimorphilus gyrociliatus TaxID=2664684 RepID=A0A7I8W018_9ANNE|nr:unnamed protein product [Dimorphilus gyrociliatus]